MRRITFAVFALAALILAAASSARAELLVFSAVDFVKRCPPGALSCGQDPTEVDRGVLVPQEVSTYYASISFPVNGQFVCRFTLIYQDTNAVDAMTARLVRKGFAGGVTAFVNPVIMATLTSAAGVSENTRAATTTAIYQPQILKGISFYYVEVEVPTVNLNILGVQIDVRTSCA